MKKSTKGLNDKQAMFCLEYIVGFNATQAAIRAGYSKKTAGAQGHDLLKKPEIQKEIVANVAERAERTKVDADWVLLKAKESFEINAAIKFNKDGDKEMINATAAGKFLDQVGKHIDVSAFSENVNHTGSVSIAIADILESIDGTSKGLPVDK